MKKHIAILSISVLIFSSCASFEGLLGTPRGGTNNGSTPTSSTKGVNTGKVLSDILTGIFGGNTLDVYSMNGTWGYTGTSAAFETEDLLKKAGGTVVATKIEKELNTSAAKLGIKSSNTYFTFNADSTYSAKVGGVSISGKYAINPNTKKVRMTYLMGMGSIDGTVALTSRNMQLLFDADSMLKLMKVLSQFSNNTSIEVLGKMADMYDGMLLGFDLVKQ